jgi:hypothetical protein
MSVAVMSKITKVLWKAVQNPTLRPAFNIPLEVPTEQVSFTPKTSRKCPKNVLEKCPEICKHFMEWESLERAKCSLKSLSLSQPRKLVKVENNNN